MFRLSKSKSDQPAHWFAKASAVALTLPAISAGLPTASAGGFKTAGQVYYAQAPVYGYGSAPSAFAPMPGQAPYYIVKYHHKPYLVPSSAFAPAAASFAPMAYPSSTTSFAPVASYAPQATGYAPQVFGYAPQATTASYAPQTTFSFAPQAMTSLAPQATTNTAAQTFSLAPQANTGTGGATINVSLAPSAGTSNVGLAPNAGTDDATSAPPPSDFKLKGPLLYAYLDDLRKFYASSTETGSVAKIRALRDEAQSIYTNYDDTVSDLSGGAQSVINARINELVAQVVREDREQVAKHSGRRSKKGQWVMTPWGLQYVAGRSRDDDDDDDDDVLGGIGYPAASTIVPIPVPTPGLAPVPFAPQPGGSYFYASGTRIKKVHR